jgi:hypothetical protein
MRDRHCGLWIMTPTEAVAAIRTVCAEQPSRMTRSENRLKRPCGASPIAWQSIFGPS